jgi:nickel-type superoxide dismutase maturation protease
MQSLLPHGALVAVSRVDATTPLHVGDVVVARRPDRRDVEMVKRIQAIDQNGALFLTGDNPAMSTDSRTFGPVPRDLVLARVRWRYWPLPPRRC